MKDLDTNFGKNISTSFFTFKVVLLPEDVCCSVEQKTLPPMHQ